MKLLLAFAFVVSAVSCAGTACADVVYFTNGNRIEGEVAETPDGKVVITVPELGTVTVGRQEVERIEEQAPAPPVLEAKPVPPHETTPTPPLPTVEVPKFKKSGASHKSLWARKPFEWKLPDFGKKPALIYYVVAIAFTFYIYFSTCLYLIAVKTGTENAWLAWIPGLNGILVCWVAGFSAWWVVLLILVSAIMHAAPPLVSLLGFLVLNLAVPIIWGVRVAVARKKSRWWGVLYVIPLFNLAVLGYFAFSDGFKRQFAIEA